jgi:hypothetical protein
MKMSPALSTLHEDQARMASCGERDFDDWSRMALYRLNECPLRSFTPSQMETGWGVCRQTSPPAGRSFQVLPVPLYTMVQVMPKEPVSSAPGRIRTSNLRIRSLKGEHMSIPW